MSGKINWSHYLELMCISNINEINYYIKLIEDHNLSVRQLRQKIKNEEYERLPKETKLKLANSKEENIVDKNCVVLDTASVKGFVTEKKRPYKFIGSHPMAGTAESGFDAGFKELFEGAKWVICPTDDVGEEDIEKAKTVGEFGIIV